jgi:hypothetical protein
LGSICTLSYQGHECDGAEDNCTGTDEVKCYFLLSGATDKTKDAFFRGFPISPIG